VEENNRYQGRKLLSTTTEETPAPASLTSESKTIWEKIEEFYSDKNNFAMYLVLPAIVLVYGGCAMIYCIAKCRQYFKRKKDKKDKRRLQDDVDDGESEDEILRNNNNERKMSSQNNDRLKTAAFSGTVNERPYSKASVSDVRVEQRETPLPWVIPDETEPYPTKKHPPPARPPPPRTRQPHDMVMSDYPKEGKQNSPNHNSDYPEKMHHDRNKDTFNRPDSGTKRYNQHSNIDDPPRKGSPRPQPVPLHENPKRHGNRHTDQGMMSPPPPYESHQHHAMGANVFTVDYSRRDDIPRKVPARPMYNPNPKVKVLSQTSGGGPVSDLEAQAMARHAAQLLRLEDKPGPGMPGYKKPKRLVFVAE
ncbi:hypothetical protein FSP39_008325, partial [Pinctada imbricata]